MSTKNHNMEITLTADFVKEPDNNGYTGWINEIHGVIAYGATLEDAKRELIKILNIKLRVERDRVREERSGSENVIKEEFKFAPTSV